MTPAHRSTSATRAPHPPWPGRRRRRRRRCQGAQVPAPTRPVKPRRWPGPAPAGTEPRPGPRSRPPRVQRFAGRPRRRQPMHPRGPGAGANGRGFADPAPKSEGGSRALKRPRLGRLKRWAPASRPSGGRSVGPPHWPDLRRKPARWTFLVPLRDLRPPLSCAGQPAGRPRRLRHVCKGHGPSSLGARPAYPS